MSEHLEKSVNMLKIDNTAKYLKYLSSDIIVQNDYTEDVDIITHSDNFHADDIFAIAIVALYTSMLTDSSIPFKVYRASYDEPLPNGSLLVDIGLGRFDHHQPSGNGFHPSIVGKSQIPYASCGLVWKSFGQEICKRLSFINYNSNKAEMFYFKFVEKNLVLAIDAADNAIFPQSTSLYDKFKIPSISYIISILNAISYDKILDSENDGLKYAIIFSLITLNKVLEDAILAYNLSTTKPESSDFIAKKESQEVIEKLVKTWIKSNGIVVNDDFYSISKYPNTYVAPIPRDTITCSNFGKIWVKYGKAYCDKVTKENEECSLYVFNSVLSQLLIGLDASIQDIEEVLPIEYESFKIYNLLEVFSSYKTESLVHVDIFCNILQIVLQNIIEISFFRISSKAPVEDIIKITFNKYPSTHILILNDHLCFQEWLPKIPEARKIWYVIMPSISGKYKVFPIPSSNSPTGFRKGFPKIWWGYNKLNSNLNLEDCSYIHSQGFLAICDTLKGAKHLCLKAISIKRRLHHCEIGNYNN